MKEMQPPHRAVLTALVGVSMCWISANAHAQYVIGGVRYTCPAGAPWNDPRCIREDEPSDGDSAAVPDGPRFQYRSGWGAVSVDLATGELGVAVGKKSRREAAKLAKKACAREGATTCTKPVTYANTCVALAWPNSGEGEAVLGDGLEVAAARQDAMSRCEARNGACKIRYEDCSRPILEYR